MGNKRIPYKSVSSVSNSLLLSLCVVALNESAFIGPCIESAKSIVDEIIVVDTGSKDGTPDIAHRHGAKVIKVKYPGDQASAFNIFLPHAQGDWILNLDADEVLDFEKKHQIRRAVKNKSFDAYFFTIRNYVYFPQTKWQRAEPDNPLTRGGHGFIPSRTVRLFKTHPENRYVGKFHQRIHPSILKQGGKIGNCSVPIHHYGHLRHARISWKFPRILAAQKTQVKENPQDPRNHIELGVVYFGMGDFRDAENSFRRAAELGYGAGAFFYLGKTFLLQGDSETAVALLNRAIRSYSVDSTIDFEPADAWEQIGRAWIELKNFKKAEWAYQKALSLRPFHPVLWNDFASLLNIQGDHQSAALLMEKLVEQQPGYDIPWLTLGIARMCKEDFKGAKGAFQRALGINPENSQAKLNLALTLEELGEKSGPGQRPLRKGQLKPVVSLIPRLSGNMGQVLASLVLTLKNESHVVLCMDSGTHSGLELKEELEEKGVEVRVAAVKEDMIRRLKQINPKLVFAHLPHPFLLKGIPEIQARWIAVGHDFLPMPRGYNAYIVHSNLHANLQSHLPRRKIYQIPLGVHQGCFKIDSHGEKSDGNLKVIMISDLDPGLFPRHLRHYLPPLKRKKVHLVVAGRGARRYEIEPELKGSGLEDVIRFVGPVPWRRIPELLLESDIGLHLPEIHEEAYPVSVMNMVAAGLPLISKPWGCIPDLVFSNKNGFLVEDESEAANKLEELIQSKELRTNMGEFSRNISRSLNHRAVEDSLKKLLCDLRAQS